MTWLYRIVAKHDNYLLHIKRNNTAHEKSRRLVTLTSEESKAYKWLFEGYSEAWVTETMGLEKRYAKELFNSIYCKLGVRNAREIVHYYAPKQVRFIKLPGSDNEDDGSKS